MSERDFFDRMGASISDDTTNTPNHTEPQSVEPDRGDPDSGSHRHSDGSSAAGEWAADSRSAQRPPTDANSSASTPIAPVFYDDRTQEITPEHIRAATTMYAPQRNEAPQYQGRPSAAPTHNWCPAPAAAHRPESPAPHQGSFTRQDRSPGFVSAAGSGELLGEQVRATDFVVPKKIRSNRGWRKWVYYLTFGTVNTGESPDEQLVRAMRNQIGAPMSGTFSVAVIGGKGGVGKTSLTTMVGSQFAVLRPHEHTIALDADPSHGANLAGRIDRSAASSYREVVAAQDIVRYSDMRARVGHNAAGLDVLASPTHRGATASGGAVGPELYVEARRRLEGHYNVLVTDCGVNIEDPVMDKVLETSDAVVMVTSAIPESAEGAGKEIDWLCNHPHYRSLMNRMVLVINHDRLPVNRKHRKQIESFVTAVAERYSRWVQPDRIFVMPHDPHLATSAVVDITELSAATQRRVLEVTACLAGGFTGMEASL